VNGKRFSRSRENGATVAAATKITPEESARLDALAAELGLSRYELIRVVLRDALQRARA
jgi:hypothetical protein